MPQSAILSDTEFQLSGHLAELGRLASEVARFCHDHALREDAAFDLNLVLEELFTNSVRHGGCAGMTDVVAIRLRRSAVGEVLVEYRDRGTPFNPLEAPAADIKAPLESRQPGGLGIHLVRQIMRDLAYDRNGDWNRLSMRRPAAEEKCCN